MTAVLLFIAFRVVAGLDNGLGLLPPMGYNTWNDLGCSMSEDKIKRKVDIMVEKGLPELGYTYVNLDDCWHAAARDNVTGRLVEDPNRFPSSMKNLSNYIHTKGLKFGIYTDRGTKTCAKRPGSYKYEYLDAQTFADWEVDYVKEDNCYSIEGPLDKPSLFKDFATFRDAINKTGRPMFFSVCGGGGQWPWTNLTFFATDPRGGKNLANSWRIHADCDEWYTCFDGAREDSAVGSWAGQGGLNDPDMMLGSSGDTVRKLRPEESRTQFNIWAILMAPLLLGVQFEKMSDWDWETFTNKEVIAVNQDPLLKQGFIVSHSWSILGYLWIWARPLKGGAWALVFQNDRMTFHETISCDANCWSRFPGLSNGVKFDVRDLWKHSPADAPVAISGQSYSVQLARGRCSAMLKLTPSESGIDTPREGVRANQFVI